MYGKFYEKNCDRAKMFYKKGKWNIDFIPGFAVRISVGLIYYFLNR